MRDVRDTRDTKDIKEHGGHEGHQGREGQVDIPYQGTVPQSVFETADKLRTLHLSQKLTAGCGSISRVPAAACSGRLDGAAASGYVRVRKHRLRL